MNEAACPDKDGPAIAAIERDASLWLLRLEDDPQDEDLHDAFEAWLASDPRHAAIWAETAALAAKIAEAGPSTIPPMIPAIPPLRPSEVARRRVWRRLPGLRQLRGMAAGAAAACLLWALAPDALLSLRADASTGTAQTRRVVLADGSVVMLAPASAIGVDVRDGHRDVHLLKGEAYFDVRHDPTHPFRVFAGRSRTRVLGTAFDVRLLAGRTDVAVSRGLVEVSLDNPSYRMLLPAGHGLALDWHGTGQSGEIRPDRVAAWREGRLIVNDRPIAEAIAAIRPWHRGFIVTRGAGLGRQRVSGLYNLRDSEAALDALGRIEGVEVRHLTPWLSIVTVR